MKNKKVITALFTSFLLFGCSGNFLSSPFNEGGSNVTSLNNYISLDMSLTVNEKGVCEYEGVYYKLDNGKFIVSGYNENIKSEIRLLDKINGIEVVSIEENCFRECLKIEKIILSNTIKTINNYAFIDCYNLKEVILSDNLINIGYNYLGSTFNKSNNGNYIKSHSNDHFLLYCLEDKYVSNVTINPNTKIIYFNALEGVNTITKIKIPSSVTKICSGAFENCTNLKEVDLSNKIQEIEQSVFNNCAGLTKIELPKSVRILRRDSFKNCVNLKEINIHSNIEKIEPDAFYNCGSLDYLKKDGLVYLGDNLNPYHALLKCEEVKDNYEINNKTNIIVSSVFKDNNLLKTITLSKELKYIGENAFNNCINLEMIDLSSTKVKEIDFLAFEKCVNLNKIKLSKELTYINDNAFRNCNKLTNIGFFDQVKRIGYYAFGNCSSLTNITLPDSIEEIGGRCFEKCVNLKEVKIGKNLKEISFSIFKECENLEKVNIEEGVESIGSSAFYKCHNLKDIKLPSTLKSIDNSSFYECRRIENIELYDGLYFIGASSFYSCTGIKEINIPKTVYHIGNNAFYGISGDVSIDEENQFFSIEDSVLYNKDKTELIAPIKFLNYRFIVRDGVKVIKPEAFLNTNYTNITIPDSVEEIGYNAFKNCTKLTTVKLSKNLKTLSSGLFENTNINYIELPNILEKIERVCFKGSSLVSIEIPDSVEEIEESAFYECKSLNNIKLPKNLKNLNDMLFRDCENLEKVILPETIEKIESNVFSGCTSLSFNKKDGIKYIGTNNNPYFAMISLDDENRVENIVTDEETKVIASWFMYYQSYVKSFVLSNKIKIIPNHCFIGSKINKITLPENLIEIGSFAFAHCSSLKNIVIPSTVEYIGPKTFTECKNLSIYLESENVNENWDEYWNDSNRPVYLKGEWEYVNGIPTKK